MNIFKKDLQTYCIWGIAAVLIFMSTINLINDLKANLVVALIFSVGMLIALLTNNLKIENKLTLWVFAYIGVYIASYLFHQSIVSFRGLLGYLMGGSFFVGAYIISKKHTNKLLYGIAIVITAVTIFSIDMASVQIISVYIALIIKSIIGINPFELTVFEEGIRMRSVITNPNVYASLTCIAIFICAYLRTEKEFHDKRAVRFMMFLNMVGFIYAFSLGAILSALSVGVLYIIINIKNDLFEKLYLIIVTSICAGIAVITGFIGMGGSGAISVLPIFTIFICYILLEFLMSVERIIFDNKRIIKIAVSIILIGIIGIIFVDKVMPKEADIFTAKSFSVPLAQGEYKLKLNFTKQEKPFDCLIYGQTYQQAKSREYSVIYNEAGAVSKPENYIEFATMQDNAAIKIEISSNEDMKLTQAEIFDFGDKKIKDININSLLIPDFMENRLQSFSVNQNAIQRFVFFEDGLKIWEKDWLFGNGPASFNAESMKVQTSNYSTDSSHNYFIDVLLETGIIGISILIIIIVGALKLLIPEIKKKNNAAIILFTILVFMIIHSCIELTFIYIPYMAIFFALISVIIGMFGKEYESRYARMTSVIVMYILNITTMFLLLNNIGKV